MEASSIMADNPALRQPAAEPGASRGDAAASPRENVVAGMRAVAPIAIAVLAFGASFGILAVDAGMGTVAPIVMSLTTFAGSAQFAVASVLESGGAVAAAIAAAVMLNLRYLAVGMSVAPSLTGGKLWRLLVAQLAIDESWAVSQRDGRVDRDRMIGAGLVLLTAWCAGTVAGVLGGGALGDPADYGLDAMFPALFLALLVGQLDGRRARVAALAGGLIALALTPLVPPGLPIVAAAAGAVIALGVRA
ncbi:MAG TPA: AzlC family ABC transporter permease [Solirubrobacteraceae bacterium]|nr:AzlC family ABC transporter permease [Solirubrobacteraceae bacterium]